MIIEKIQDFNLNDIVLICSLPDMGKVGGLVTEHLVKIIEAKNAVKIKLSDKPWVNQKNGLINLPQDEYTIAVNEENSIVIFTGENQPQEPNSVFEMSELVLSTVSKMGNIKLVISTGGYLPAKQENGAVYGVSTNEKSLSMLKSHNIEPLGPEVNSITWFNGLVLGIAKTRNIDGIGLFGEIIDAESPQYKAAKNVISVISKILGIKIDTKELEQKIVELPPEVKKEGPGIG